MRLANKVVFLSGVARGLGEAIAKLFAKEGAHVIITDINDELGKTVAISLALSGE